MTVSLHSTASGPPVRGAPVRGVEEVAPALPRLTLANSTKREEDAETPRGHRQLAESVKAILVADPGSPHRLNDLASMLGVSPSHLAHVFRAEVGLGLHQYLLQVRMALALDRLSDGAADLSRLAVDLGFVTHSHFTAVFRRWFGMPPSRVRELLRAQSQQPSSEGTATDRGVVSRRPQLVAQWLD